MRDQGFFILKERVMNELQVLSNDKWSVRTVKIDNNIWFVATDICKHLNVENNRSAVARLDNDEKGDVLISTIRGMQKVKAVNEFGLYSLIFTSRKQESKDFKRWVTHEVLPQIRKTGKYSNEYQNDDEISDTQILKILVPVTNAFADQVKNLGLENKNLKEEIKNLNERIERMYNNIQKLDQKRFK